MDEGVSSKLEAVYVGMYNFIREAEVHMDSPFDIKGEVSVVRRNFFEHLV